VPEVAQPPRGVGPGRLALRRLRRDRTALAFLGVFLILLLACLAAPLWAHAVAHTTAAANHLTDQIRVGGRTVDVVSPDGKPIGPTWHGRFFLGADENGRDIMVRLLYGGRTSLAIGFGAALLTTAIALLVGLLAGYYRGWVDGVLGRVLDVVWAYPVVLLGIALGTALSIGGLKLGPLELSGSSAAIPLLIIGVVYVPYMARPIRAQVLALREREFVDAARVQGAGAWQIMTEELLPNLATTAIVFFPLMVANAILLEAALSFLGAGVQPPTPSWGRMLGDGTQLITSAPHLTIVPGLMLVVCVLALNVFGDGVREALDPRARVRVER
jgi:peptide/nickel transport system permease protein